MARRRSSRRLLSILIAAAMVLGIMPVMETPARADDVTEVSTSEQLKTAVENGGAIRLLADISGGNIPFTKDTTLDLNGHGVYNTHFSVNGATLTLTDSDPTAVHKYRMHENSGWIDESAGTLELQGGYLSGLRYEDRRYVFDYNCVSVGDGGVFVMQGGTILGYRNHSCVSVGSGGTFRMESGAMTRNFYNSGVVSVGEGGSFIMTGGSIHDNLHYVKNSIINGPAPVHVNGGSFIMRDGEIANNRGKEAGAVCVGPITGTFLMEGGKITGNSGANAGAVLVKRAHGRQRTTASSL